VKIWEERIQKTHGARRSMWGEDGNDVRPYQIETMLAVWSARGNDIRSTPEKSGRTARATVK
jgi:hypothetical protein